MQTIEVNPKIVSEHLQYKRNKPFWNINFTICEYGAG